jgi:hypothetical protein
LTSQVIAALAAELASIHPCSITTSNGDDSRGIFA